MPLFQEKEQITLIGDDTIFFDICPSHPKKLSYSNKVWRFLFRLLIAILKIPSWFGPQLPTHRLSAMRTAGNCFHYSPPDGRDASIHTKAKNETQTGDSMPPAPLLSLCCSVGILPPQKRPKSITKCSPNKVNAITKRNPVAHLLEVSM